MNGKEFEEVSMVCLANALELEDLAEVGVGAVGNVDEVGLDEGFWRRWPDLEGFEEGVEARHGCVDAFDKAVMLGRVTTLERALTLLGAERCGLRS